jgi:hypothetical protein
VARGVVPVDEHPASTMQATASATEICFTRQAWRGPLGGFLARASF